jgi:hypothetical protein
VNGATTGLLAFIALLAAVAAGATAASRMPRLLASPGSHDVIRRMISLLAILAALTLGMSIVALKTTFNSADGDVRRLGSQIEELDRTLRRIGPTADEARQLLFRYTAVLLRQDFPGLDAPLIGESRDVDALQDDLEGALERLAAGGNVARPVVEAQADMHAIVQTRWDMVDESGPSVSNWQTGVLLFWLVLVFGGLALIAPRNPLAIATLVLGAVALAFAVFLLKEFDDPFVGVITVSGEPLLNALHALAD